MSWLEGRRLRATGSGTGPAACAAALLARLGAGVSWGRGPERVGGVRIEGWETGAGTGVAAGLGPATWARVRRAYLGGLAAARLLEGGGSVRAAELAGLLAGMPAAAGAELVRCRDGWMVVRWRSPEERRLLAGAVRRQSLDECWREARDLRLLAAPVRRAGRAAGAGPACWRVLAEGGGGGRVSGRLRVVDWSSLWAGPWAAARLLAAGARVSRIEHPLRRDGLLGSDRGRRLWGELNGAKALLLADAATGAGRARVAEAVAGADVLIAGHSLRVLPQLGFDDRWFRERAPRTMRLELVAFNPPHEALPGLGEQAAAIAGLLWRRGGPPRPPLPWADPVAGVICLLLVRAWEAAGRPAGAHARVSLEGAAALCADAEHRSAL